MRTLRADQSGQSLIIVVLAMTVVLGIAALTIDVGSWFVKHHQAQVAADAAALAASNCLANAGSGQTCVSTTDTTAAATVATTIAKDNGVTIPTSDVNFSGKSVTVTTPKTAPAFFANVFGIHSTVQTGHATAAWTPPTPSPCTDASSGNCDFMFAADSDCSNSSNGIDFSTTGKTTITGIIQSNSNLSGSTKGNPSFGTTTYGPNNTTGTCSNSVTSNGNEPWTTAPTAASADLTWPIPYTQDFPACNPTGQPACSTKSASLGYPTFCTQAAANFTSLSPGKGDVNIYCASGTGSTSDPSTWNGTISISQSSTETWYDSFVAGSISFAPKGKITLSSCGYGAAGFTASNCVSGVPAPATTNYPIFYAIDSGSQAFTFEPSGNQTMYGDIFVPNGQAYFNSSGAHSLTTFIEANDIYFGISGNLEGDGPQGGSDGKSTPGSDSLTQ